MPYTCISKNTLYCYYIDGEDISNNNIPEDIIHSMRNDLKQKLKLMNMKLEHAKEKGESIDLG